jgi:hypothetical protein
LKYIVGFFRFWYDFIIGDCWQIAAGTVVVLGTGALIAHIQAISQELIAPAVGIGIFLVAVLSLFTSTQKKSD